MDKKSPLKLSELLILSSQELKQVFGIELLLQKIAIQFESMLQSHLSMINDKMSEIKTQESLKEYVEKLSLVPENFIGLVAEYIDDTSTEAIHIKAVACYEYIAMVSHNCKIQTVNMAKHYSRQIQETGIVTVPAGTIIQP